MEVYKAETAAILKRYRAGQTTHKGCIAALNAAVAKLVPRLKAEQVESLRALYKANNEAVAREVKRRTYLPL